MQRVPLSPLSSAGSVRLRGKREDVHSLLGAPQSSYRKSPSAQHPTDSWYGGALQVFYGSDPPEVEYIELSRGGEVEAHLFGMDVFATPAKAVLAVVRAHTNLREEEEGCSYVSSELEIALWRESVESATFATVGIGTPGYFSEVEA
jgi:hypothetical protein